ncbi:MAG: aminotransferase DegT [Gammaproteobacteria bacterium]|jgi:perosamine synthetase|nr:aminotransferase DegT [Gammaproteobacteria bacterium]
MNNTQTNQTIHAIKSCLPAKSIALHEPEFIGNEWNYVKECIDTRWVSSVGKFVDQFEANLAAFTGAKYAVATVNGTAALHMAFMLADVGQDDEVLVPSLTFVATCNAIAYCRALPHFVDCDEKTLGVDFEKLNTYLNEIAEIKQGKCFNKLTGRCIKALCVMHTFGHPVDLDPLAEICQRYHIALIEDAAEALGSYYKGEHVGNKGIMATLSFNGNKIITTGGGGALITNNERLAKLAKHLTTTAKLPHAWKFQHDQVGYNYRLPNINAALGCAQLESLEKFLYEKRALATQYQKALAKVQQVRFITEPDYAKSNYWLNAILLSSALEKDRDGILQAFNEQGIGVRPVWELMHHLPMYQNCPRMDLSSSESLAKRIINIPSSACLGRAYA